MKNKKIKISKKKIKGKKMSTSFFKKFKNYILYNYTNM